MELGPLISIFLFFVLVGGLIIIYSEELQKMEFFGRLQTTPVSKVIIPENKNTHVSVPIPSAPIPSAPPSQAFSSGRTVAFGTEGGRITDVRAREVNKIEEGVVLHTITNGVTNYYAQGFLKEIEELYKPSPHAGKVVFLDRISGIQETEPEREYVALLVSSATTSAIDISGWKIFDRRKRVTHKIPKAVRILGSDQIQKEEVVRAGPGDLIIITSGSSPTGTSFRVNKCSGYRSQFKNFTPSIKTECPDALEEFQRMGTVPYTDNQCYSIVENLSACKAVTRIPATVTRECRDFLENTVTEQGCVRLHRNDKDFFQQEWRLFLETKRELWERENNVLYLLDERNLLITTLVY